MGAELAGEPRGPTQHQAAVQSEIDSANDVVEVDRRVIRGALHVGTGPYRANGVVEDFGGDRPEQEAAEGSVAVGRHHDEVALLGGSELDDGLGRGAL